jgi:hypothetical protein
MFLGRHLVSNIYCINQTIECADCQRCSLMAA